MVVIEPVEVLRGKHNDSSFPFGPLPGVRLENVVAYEFELPERFEPWPGRPHLEGAFVLLDARTHKRCRTRESATARNWRR